MKPANILLSSTRQAVLTDFGSCASICQPVGNRQDALNIQDHAASHSTASIRAPELVDTPSSGVTITGKADIWSLGCTFFACLFARTPFEDPVQGLSTLAVLSGTFKYPPGHHWPQDWTSLISACLLPSLEARLSLESVRGALEVLSEAPPQSVSSFVAVEVVGRGVREEERRDSPVRGAGAGAGLGGSRGGGGDQRHPK